MKTYTLRYQPGRKAEAIKLLKDDGSFEILPANDVDQHYGRVFVRTALTFDAVRAWVMDWPAEFDYIVAEHAEPKPESSK